MNFERLKNSFGYAIDGFKFAYKADQNLRIHLLVALAVILLAFFLGVTRIEFVILVFAIVLVLWAEMMNTVIEKTVDLLISDHHPSAKIAKDVSSAMVLLTSIGASVVGLVIFLPYFF